MTVTKEHQLSAGVNKLRAACNLPPLGKNAGRAPCLGCQQDFESPDRTRIRRCNKCKSGKEWSSSRDSDANLPAVPTNVASEMRSSSPKNPVIRLFMAPKAKRRVSPEGAG